MDNEPNRTIVERIDYERVFNFTRLFAGFRVAVNPSRLLLALLIIVLLYICGFVIDAIAGSRSVEPGEFQQYITAKTKDTYDQWLKGQLDNRTERVIGYIQLWKGYSREEAEEKLGKDTPGVNARALVVEYYQKQLEEARQVRDQAEGEEAIKQTSEAIEKIMAERSRSLKELEALLPKPVFQSAMHVAVDIFSRGVQSALDFKLGLDQLNPNNPPNPDSVIGAIRSLFLSLPGWLWRSHPTFFCVFLALSIFIWSLLGGAIARQAIFEVSGNRPLSATESVAFVYRRWPAYILAPLMPFILVGVVALLLAMYGLVFFNVAVLDLIGALMFGLALVGGFIMALLLVASFGGIHLMYPALSAEGSDAIGATGQTLSFILARPWRMLLYTLVALIFGAATYLFVGLFIFFVLYLTQWAVSAWAFNELAEGVNRFDAILPKPEFGNLIYAHSWEYLGVSSTIAAAIVRIQVYLVIGLLAAYAISYYFSAFSIIYLLLRRKHDGVDFAEVYEEPAGEPVADKVEPVGESESGDGAEMASDTPDEPKRDDGNAGG